MSDLPIKSVKRVFEILELFNEERRPLPAKEIAKRLNYPLMSAHALLKSIHELGYADFDSVTWSYTPTRSFPDLLDWVRDFLDREPHILEFANAANYETKETVNLSRRMDTKVKIIHGKETSYTLGVSVKIGTVMPVTSSLTGMAALSVLSDAEIETFLSHVEKVDPEQAKSMDRVLLSEIISEFREVGMVTRCGLVVPDIGAVCVPVCAENSSEIIIVGVVGPSDRIALNQMQHKKTLKRLATQHGVRTAHKLKIA